MGCLKLTERDFLKLHNCSKKSAYSRFSHTATDDTIGNRTSAASNETGSTVTTSYTTNNLNQYTQISKGGIPYPPSYDDDGNCTSAVLSSPSGGSSVPFSFTFNAENRIISMETSTQKLEYVYDYMGRRVEKKVYSGSTGNWSLITDNRFLYSGFKCVAEINALTGKVLRFNQWNGEQLLGVLNVQKGTQLSCLTDGNKNVIGLMGNNGEISAKFAYSPFGQLLSSQNANTAECSFGFSCEYRDTETGLVYYNYRYYSLELGRWLSHDPIGERGGENLYYFVFNNAPNSWDLLEDQIVMNEHSTHTSERWYPTGNWELIDEWHFDGLTKRGKYLGFKQVYIADGCICKGSSIWEKEGLFAQYYNQEYIVVSITQFGPTKGERVGGRIYASW